MHHAGIKAWHDTSPQGFFAATRLTALPLPEMDWKNPMGAHNILSYEYDSRIVHDFDPHTNSETTLEYGRVIAHGPRNWPTPMRPDSAAAGNYEWQLNIRCHNQSSVLWTDIGGLILTPSPIPFTSTDLALEMHERYHLELMHLHPFHHGPAWPMVHYTTTI